MVPLRHHASVYFPGHAESGCPTSLWCRNLKQRKCKSDSENRGHASLLLNMSAAMKYAVMKLAIDEVVEALVTLAAHQAG